MILRRFPLLVVLVALAACDVAPVEAPQPPAAKATGLPSPEVAARNVATVMPRVMRVAEAYCTQLRPKGPCDFRFAIDEDPRHPPNAFQTVDRQGDPVIGMTVSLVATARNQDELAFILGHEAAHHIRGHLERTTSAANEGSLLGGILADISGGTPEQVKKAQEYGAAIGARRYSKEYELEADALGARIAYAAGYDPLVGAQYFNRIPNPRDAFLSTHPPNAQRIETVRRVVAQIRAGS